MSHIKKRSPKRKLTRLEKLSEQAMLSAARKVREENKRLGEPLIVYENGKLKKIPASEL